MTFSHSVVASRMTFSHSAVQVELAKLVLRIKRKISAFIVQNDVFDAVAMSVLRLFCSCGSLVW